MHIKTRDEWSSERAALMDALVEFAAVMERRPFQNEAGLRGLSAFALYWYVKTLAPTLVLEVGVWRGFSTWIIQQAAPHAEIHGFDPIFFFGGEPQPTYRTPSAVYHREDFSCVDLSTVITDPDRTVVFFDDHHRQIARLEQAIRLGLKHVIFDDNPPEPYSHRTLEDERRDPASRAALESLAERYEVFPALWPIDFQHEIRIEEPGYDFPVTPQLQYLYDERIWHSYVTYVRTRPAAALTAIRPPLGSETTLTVPTAPGSPSVDIHIRLSTV